MSRLLLLLAILLLSACSGPQWVEPECRDTYDECINSCAYDCDQGTTTTGPENAEQVEGLDTWGQGCQRCTALCAELASGCAESRAATSLED